MPDLCTRATSAHDMVCSYASGFRKKKHSALVLVNKKKD